MLLLQLIVNGICIGGLYALMGIGFTLVYSTTRIFHVAYGSVIISSQYVFYLAFTYFNQGFIVSFAAAVFFAAAFGIVIQVFVYQVLQKRGVSLSGLMIISLGVFYVVQNVLAIIFSVGTRTLNFFPPILEVGMVRLPLLYLEADAVVTVVVILCIVFLHKTDRGIMLRGLADNANLILVTGTNPTALFVLAAALGSAIGALAGGFMVMDVGVRPDIGFTILLKAAIVSIVGGVGSVPGVLLAGVTLGIVENLVVWKLPAEWQGVLVYFVLLVVLIGFKEGILTRGYARREV